jgi:hypothetical protein
VPVADALFYISLEERMTCGTWYGEVLAEVMEIKGCRACSSSQAELDSSVPLIDRLSISSKRRSESFSDNDVSAYPTDISEKLHDIQFGRCIRSE